MPNVPNLTWVTLGRLSLRARQGSAKVRSLDERFGEGRWRLRHLVGTELLDISQAAAHVEQSYRFWLQVRPELTAWLCATAREVIQFSLTNARAGLDYSIQERKQEHVYDIALRRVLHDLGLELRGTEVVRLGGRTPTAQLLSPGVVAFHNPALILSPPARGWWQTGSVECFWQSNRVIQVARQA